MPVASKRHQRRQERRDVILQTARDVFLRKGYTATGMDEIAEAAGLSVGSVYLYFSSKPVLYLSILESVLADQEEALRRAAARARTATEKLLKLAEAYVDYFLREPEYFGIRIFLQNGELGIPEADALAAGLVDRALALLQLVAGLIETGIKEGEFRKVDPFQSALFLWGSWNGVIGLTFRKSTVGLDRKNLKRLLRMGADLIGTGLAANPRRGRARSSASWPRR